MFSRCHQPRSPIRSIRPVSHRIIPNRCGPTTTCRRVMPFAPWTFTGIGTTYRPTPYVHTALSSTSPPTATDALVSIVALGAIALLVGTMIYAASYSTSWLSCTTYEICDDWKCWFEEQCTPF